MDILTNTDITPLILDKYLCCRRHLFMIRLTNKKINAFIINQKNYYKLLEKFTKDLFLILKDDYTQIYHEYYNLNTMFHNITTYNLTKYETDTDNSYNTETSDFSYDTDSTDEIDLQIINLE